MISFAEVRPQDLNDLTRTASSRYTLQNGQVQIHEETISLQQYLSYIHSDDLPNVKPSQLTPASLARLEPGTPRGLSRVPHPASRRMELVCALLARHRALNFASARQFHPFPAQYQ